METKKPRNIIKVIEAIKKELPKHPQYRHDGAVHRSFTNALNEISYNAGFRAPEVQVQSWYELDQLLNRYLDRDTEPGITIAAIMRDEIDVGAQE